MAENIMYLVCTECGECIELGRSYGDMLVYYPKDEPLEKRLNRFYFEHIHSDFPDMANFYGTNFQIYHEKEE